MSDSRDEQGPYPDIDDTDAALAENQTVTNDAVAGETVLPGAGEGNNSPTGGSPREAEPILDEHSGETAEDTREIDLDSNRHED